MTVKTDIVAAIVTGHLGLGGVGRLDVDVIADLAVGAIRQGAVERVMSASDEHAARCGIEPCPFKSLDEPEAREIIDAILGEP